MHGKAIGIALLGLAALGAAAACGGRTDTSSIDLGDGGDDAQPSPTGSSGGPWTTGSGASSGMNPGGSSGTGSSGYGSNGFGSSGGSSGYAGPCSPDVRAFGAQSSLACWGCVAKGCPMQLYACAQDCTCNESVVKALECVNGGSAPFDCFTSTIGAGTGDPLLSAFANCLVQAGGDCGCGMTADAGLDASPGCVDTGGGGSFGTGMCNTTLAETCGGASYTAVCSCPRGSCVCFGDTTTIIPLNGCPYCPDGLVTAPGTPTRAEIFAACGFPH
jgi:hypothetical protein